MVHNIDVCCWAKNAWPIAAQGQGGRLALTQPGQWYDHYNVEYFFADGTRLLAQGRHMNDCWDIYSDFAHGTKGSAVIMESLARPTRAVYRSQLPDTGKRNLALSRPTTEPLPNRRAAVRKPAPVGKSLPGGARPAVRGDPPGQTAQRGPTVCHGGHGRDHGTHGGLQRSTGWLGRGARLQAGVAAPGLESYTWDSTPPVLPDKQGRYPVPIPGMVKAF